uniref:SET domain-containing protein n=1 Tax=Terrapene triunguis TaxID=2587831 RepID=A0A674IK02_9SAUR
IIYFLNDGKGSLIMTYVIKYISRLLSKLTHYDFRFTDSYLFLLTYVGKKCWFYSFSWGIYLLDATKEGNVGRFLNHSCWPNLFVQSVFVETHNRNFPLVAFFTNRHVKAGTELTWDYGYEAGSMPETEISCQCGVQKLAGWEVEANRLAVDYAQPDTGRLEEHSRAHCASEL